MTFYITLKANIKVYYHLKAIRIETETYFCQTKTRYFFIDQRNHHKVKDEGPLFITGVIFLYSFIGYLRYLEDYRHAPLSQVFCETLILKHYLVMQPSRPSVLNELVVETIVIG